MRNGSWLRRRCPRSIHLYDWRNSEAAEEETSTSQPGIPALLVHQTLACCARCFQQDQKHRSIHRQLVRTAGSFPLIMLERIICGTSPRTRDQDRYCSATYAIPAMSLSRTNAVCVHLSLRAVSTYISQWRAVLNATILLVHGIDWNGYGSPV